MVIPRGRSGLHVNTNFTLRGTHLYRNSEHENQLFQRYSKLRLTPNSTRTRQCLQSGEGCTGRLMEVDVCEDLGDWISKGHCELADHERECGQGEILQVRSCADEG